MAAHGRRCLLGYQQKKVIARYLDSQWQNVRLFNHWAAHSKNQTKNHPTYTLHRKHHVFYQHTNYSNLHHAHPALGPLKGRLIQLNIPPLATTPLQHHRPIPLHPVRHHPPSRFSQFIILSSIPQRGTPSPPTTAHPATSQPTVPHAHQSPSPKLRMTESCLVNQLVPLQRMDML